MYCNNYFPVLKGNPCTDSFTICPELSKDATKSPFKTARVRARSLVVSPDIHYRVCSDLHLPNLRAATPRRTCSRTNYMNKNLSSLLRLYSTLKNSGKSSVVALGKSLGAALLR